jgi:hypothetical protein
VELSRAIAEAVAERAPGTVCPSEVARALWPADWRAHMDEVRDAAHALADRGELEVTQGGTVVDGRAARGPVRLRRPAS